MEEPGVEVMSNLDAPQRVLRWEQKNVSGMEYFGASRSMSGLNHLKNPAISESFEVSKLIDKVNIPCYLSS